MTDRTNMTLQEMSANPYDPIVEILEEARGIITDGWAQGAFYREGGAYCTTGAIAESSGIMIETDEGGKAPDTTATGHDLYIEACWHVADAIKLESDKPVDDALAQWNDEPWRTRDEVVEAFTAAVKERQER